MSLLGIYEKALPRNITWLQRLKLAKKLGFNFVEMSIDETEERLARLDWPKTKRKEVIEAIQLTEIKILSICLSGHRRFPFGSEDAALRKKAMEILEKAVDLASDLGIRTIQLAGYDVYYEKKTVSSREYFIQNIKKAVQYASQKEVTLAIEIMDDPFINSITKFEKIKAQIPSPWLQVYPDLGNLSAWPENDISFELEKGIGSITGIHLKDTLAITNDFGGKFKEVPFGSGCVDFHGCLQTLKRLNYSGPFLVEMWSETSNDPELEIQKAKEFLLPLLKEVGYCE